MSVENTSDPMPVFTIKAKDKLALLVVEEYRKACVRAGLYDQATEVGKALAEIAEWRYRHPELVKMPDHKHVPVTEKGRIDG